MPRFPGPEVDSPNSQQSDRLLEQLCRNSVPYNDPLTRVNWGALTHASFWIPEEAMSVFGLPEYHALPLQQRQALSHYEFMNFIEAGLWLEGLFMERIARSLRNTRQRPMEVAYQLHELREEAGHSLMFLELLSRHGPLRPNTRFHRWNLANMVARHAPFESVVFWVAVLIGEEVPDRMNRFIRNRRAEICPTIYDMVTTHIVDEARHVAHARDNLDVRLGQLPNWKKRLFRPFIDQVFREFVDMFYFPGPRVYELAGLHDGARWAKQARTNPHRHRFVDNCVDSSLRGLRQHGLSLNWRP